MVAVAGKRSTMVLYGSALDPYSHQVRIVIAEKGISAEIIEIRPGEEKPQELFEINPYGSLPTLVDRDLVLYESRIILEYLDERFPHPPLMPVYPIAKAEARRMMFRIEKDWYTKMNKILFGKNVENDRKNLRDALVGMSPAFATTPYFVNEDFSLLDCWVAPLLWRLQKLDIELPKNCKPIHEYMKRVFNRPSFKSSLTEVETEYQVA